MGNPAGAERCLADLIERVYDSILEPARWADFLRELAATVGAERPVLFGHDQDRGAGALSVAIDTDDGWIRDYDKYYGARNVWLMNGRHLLKSGTVRTSHMMCSRVELERSEFYNDYLKRIGTTHGLGATIWHEGSYSYNITLMRAPHVAPFASDEIRLIERLMPHLRRATQIHRHICDLALERRAQAEALDSMAAALIFVDVHCRVIFSNHAARAMADAADGLRIVAGRLGADRGAETKILQRLVEDAAHADATGSRAGGGVMTITRRSLAPPLSVLVTSLPIGQDVLVKRPPVAAVFVFDSAAPGESAEPILIRLYGLTRAEARIVGRLLTGETVEQAAGRLAISSNTARTHLKRALAKTGTNRQTELMRRLLTGPVGMRVRGLR